MRILRNRYILLYEALLTPNPNQTARYCNSCYNNYARLNMPHSYTVDNLVGRDVPFPVLLEAELHAV